MPSRAWAGTQIPLTGNFLLSIQTLWGCGAWAQVYKKGLAGAEDCEIGGDTGQLIWSWRKSDNLNAELKRSCKFLPCGWFLSPALLESRGSAYLDALDLADVRSGSLGEAFLFPPLQRRQGLLLPRFVPLLLLQLRSTEQRGQ